MKKIKSDEVKLSTDNFGKPVWEENPDAKELNIQLADGRSFTFSYEQLVTWELESADDYIILIWPKHHVLIEGHDLDALFTALGNRAVSVIRESPLQFGLMRDRVWIERIKVKDVQKEERLEDWTNLLMKENKSRKRPSKNDPSSRCWEKDYQPYVITVELADGRAFDFRYSCSSGASYEPYGEFDLIVLHMERYAIYIQGRNLTNLFIALDHDAVAWVRESLYRQPPVDEFGGDWIEKIMIKDIPPVCRHEPGELYGGICVEGFEKHWPCL